MRVARERRNAEATIQESEQKFRDLLGALPAAIYVTDAAGRITYCNHGAADLWGVTPTLGVDKWCDFACFYHADGTPMPQWNCPTEIALREGRAVCGREALMERRDGRRIYIMPNPTPLHDATGAVTCVVNMTLDISERKQAELALAERDLQLALAGKAARVRPPQATLRQACARCSVTINGRGSGRSNTCRATWSVAIAAVNAAPHVVQARG